MSVARASLGTNRRGRRLFASLARARRDGERGGARVERSGALARARVVFDGGTARTRRVDGDARSRERDGERWFGRTRGRGEGRTGLDGADRGIREAGVVSGDGVSGARAADGDADVQAGRAGGGGAVALGGRDVGDAGDERGEGCHRERGDEFSRG